MTPSNPSDSTREGRVNQVITDYLKSVEEGKPLDRHGLPDHSARVTIDWSVVAEFLCEWVIAIGRYFFAVLALGLVGGMFGECADGLLSFLNGQLAGYGRQCGWLLGAVGGAVGVPLGWVQVLSFPTPRKFSKTISDGVAQRRRKKDTQAESAPDAVEVRSVADVVKGGGIFGLIGLVLGFILGMCLLMCWFSLALSPFAPDGWFDAIEFTSAAHSDNQGGMSVTTSNPIAVFLALTPALILAGIGFVGGMIFSLSQYVHYLRTVSRDIRACHRCEQRAVLRSKSCRWYVLIIGIVFTLAGGSLGVWATMRSIQAAASRGWPQVSGRITESTVKSREGSEAEVRYAPSVNYTYEVDRSRYVGDRISLGIYASGSFGDANSLVHRYPAGKEVQVYYNPDRPERSVLEPGQTLGMFLFLGFGGLFLVIGFFTVLTWAERFMARRPHNSADDRVCAGSLSDPRT